MHRDSLPGILLAAGGSTRMGCHKILELIDGKPLGWHALRNAAEGHSGPWWVVLGRDGELVQDALDGAAAGRSVKWIRNAAWREGISTSLRAGIEATRDYHQEGLMVALADQPGIQPGTFRRLLEAFRAGGGKRITRPSYEGRPGHPVVWPSSLLPALKGLEGDSGGRALMTDPLIAVSDVPVDDPGVCLDVDTPDDLAGVRRFQHLASPPPNEPRGPASE